MALTDYKTQPLERIEDPATGFKCSGEILQDIEKFISYGIELIKGKQYQMAMDFYRNEGLARELGVHLLHERVHITEPVLDQERVDEICYRLSVNSSCKSSEGSYFIKLAELEVGPRVIQKLQNDGKYYELLGVDEEVIHHMTLVHAEEWLHYFFTLTGSDYDPSTAKGLYEELLIDEYLAQRGVPMTRVFLLRHGIDHQGELARMGYSLDYDTEDSLFYPRTNEQT